MARAKPSTPGILGKSPMTKSPTCGSTTSSVETERHTALVRSTTSDRSLEPSPESLLVLAVVLDLLPEFFKSPFFMEVGAVVDVVTL